MDQVLERIGLEDLSDDQREFAEIIGMEKYRELVKIFGGTAIYVPQQATFERSARNELIRTEFNGYNYDELARKYKLTAIAIRYIVSDLSKRMRSGVCKDQISMFDL